MFTSSAGSRPDGGSPETVELVEVVFDCIIPENIRDMDMEMSPLMRDKFPVLEELLMKELARHGIRPEKTHA